MKTSSTILTTLFTSALCFHTGSAFVDMGIAAPLLAAPPSPTSLIAPEAAVLGDQALSAFAESPLGSSTLGIANAIALPAQAAATAFANPEFESEFLEDMAHLALDFSGIFRPCQNTVRLFSLGGRLLALMADYLPDHSVHTEELLIQVFFMGMTMKEMLEEELQGPVV